MPGPRKVKNTDDLPKPPKNIDHFWDRRGGYPAQDTKWEDIPQAPEGPGPGVVPVPDTTVDDLKKQIEDLTGRLEEVEYRLNQLDPYYY